jgi:hypothetical protein
MERLLKKIPEFRLWRTLMKSVESSTRGSSVSIARDLPGANDAVALR